MISSKLFFLKKKNIRTIFFFIGLFCIYCDSYNFFSIPIPWIGLMLCTLSCISNQIMPFPKLLYSIILLILVLIIITSIKYKYNNAPLDFIAIRFINILAFVIILNYFASQNYQNKNFLYLEKNLINIGLFFSLIAILLFFIQMFNLQGINFLDFLRNRLTTGGGEIYTLKYNYNFDDQYVYYRAIGTFREPSLLVNALVLPLFLSIKNKRYLSMAIFSLSIYLTYSLAMFFAISFGLIFSVVVIYKKKLVSKNFILSALFVIFLTFLFLLYLNFGPEFSNIYLERLAHLSENNSRDYIYKNLEIILGEYWFGNGVGYGFFKLAEHILGSSDIPVSFLSLPLNIWSSGGIIGLAIIIYLILAHNILTLINFKSFNRDLYFYIVPLNVFFILYFSSFEELHIWHAIALGMFLSYLNSFKQKN